MNATTVKARLHDLTHPTGVEDTLSVDFPNNRPFRLAITPPAAIGVAILCALVGAGFIAWHFCAPPANPAAGARLSSPHTTVPLVPASAAATT
ncbi:MAG: ComEA family DNA-binding protein, partial [Corynebacterium matruchotii]